MNVKYTYLTSMVMLFSSAAMADGRIDFVGQITDQSCQVDIDGTPNNATVTLPTVSNSLLTKVGDTTGDTRFNMTVHDCVTGTDNVSKVAAFFHPGASVSPDNGRLLQQATTSQAENVSLQLIDGTNNTTINVGSSDQVTGAGYVNLPADETSTVTLPYHVRYYSEGATTPGIVNSYVMFNLMYK
ncbi:fimbrial protein [Serratia plymuthica]|uniref:fimbrial protein n=1 Tax=Serratia plymuthica TaxID=82996 RepID=UPI003DA54342